MKTLNDIELIDKLYHEISRGEVQIVEQTNNLVEKIESLYPIGFNGIRWGSGNFIFFDNYLTWPLSKKIFR